MDLIAPQTKMPHMSTAHDFYSELSAQYEELRTQLNGTVVPEERLSILEKLSAISKLMVKQSNLIVAEAPKEMRKRPPKE
jgi:hypothetical protein